MENFHLKFFADNPKSPKKLGDLEIPTEFCYHIITNQIDFYEVNKEKLDVLLSHSPFQKDSAIRKTSKFSKNVIEIGPRVAVKTAMCSNILSAFETAGIKNISRIERSIRYETTKNDLFELLADKMTEQIYDENVNFENNYKEIENFYEIDILSDKSALEKANLELGLALDNSDIEFYYDYFANKLGRNPTDVELFDLAQSDSEHSRHWFFRGNLKIDGKLVEGGSLMSKIRKTLDTSNKNSLIAFHDNSSSIKGFENVSRLRPNNPTTASSFDIHNSPSNLIYSAETHNFPTGVCPFQGATTGTGGRIRDIHSTGRGAYEIAASVGYSFGNLNIPGWLMEWEDEIEKRESYPKSLSEPLKIAIEASNGASDYGNKFGEPVICGFARSFGQRIGGERIEYVKPIMFSGGIGSIDDDEIEKKKCEPGMIVAKIGGPVYRIGVGGGAASSVDIQGKREDFLDFAAVQRGDAEMEQKMHRIVRGCAERNEGNPLLSIHDQGAGGNGNVIKELVEGCGVIVDSSEFILGDSSISLRELWTAEYQENDAALIDPQLIDIVQKIAKREKCHISLVGKVIEDQIIQLKGPQGNAVNLDTKQLGEREKKTFELETRAKKLVPLEIPKNLKLLDALNRVLRLPSVASKRYLTCKVDRSVTGLIAQQQCVGPLHTPLADVGIVALSHFEKVGGAVSLGEQPIKMLVDVEKGVRLCLSETLLNLIWAPITDIKDIKMSGNWMWAAKCEGEGARLVSAVDSLCDALRDVGCAIDGGKDSLSMAVKVNEEVVKAPGTLVLSAYVTCPDITKKVTPNLKTSKNLSDADSVIILINFTDSKSINLGGTAFAQVYRQIGDEIDDVTDFQEFVNRFNKIQKLIENRKILAGHDISDGGMIVGLLEMAFAGNCGISANFEGQQVEELFSEAPAVLIEVEKSDEAEILSIFGKAAKTIGNTHKNFGPDGIIKIALNGELVLQEKLVELREIWEELGDQLGKYQTNELCLEQAKMVRETTKQIGYKCGFDFEYEVDFINDQTYFENAPRIAIIREEGSNGDREMASAFTLAGFQTFDVTMSDLSSGHTLSQYQGVAFVGGFSYADVLGSAKGWAAGIQFNEKIREQFQLFLARENTFSFGVCNGCQLMALLGWIGMESDEVDVFLEENKCERFESSFGPVKISENNKSIMLQNMEHSILGLWSSHGEGRFTYSSPNILRKLEENGQICVRFVDGDGKSAKDYGNNQKHLPYPMNPNGSESDVAAICSQNGRHLAMMPHSDRSFLSWQWPDYPFSNSNSSSNLSPWIKMFRNAYDWCKTH